MIMEEAMIGFFGSLIGVLAVLIYEYLQDKFKSISNSSVESYNVQRNLKDIEKIKKSKVSKKVCTLKHNNINDNLKHIRDKTDGMKEKIDKIYKMNGGG